MDEIKFWEKWGFVHGSWQGWFEPKDCGGRYIGDNLPPITLDNLFLYCVPQVRRKVGKAELLHILKKWAYKVSIDDADPAQALAEALDKLKEISDGTM